MEIVDNTATFSISNTGAITRQTYMGNFKCKCLMSPMEQINADKLYRQLLGENMLMASDRAKTLAFALSQLKYRLLEVPPFWENKILGGSHIIDDNIIIEVANLAVEAEEKYMDEKTKEAEEIEQRLNNSIRSGDIEPEPELEEEDI